MAAEWVTAWATVASSVIVLATAIVAIVTLRVHARETEAVTRPVLVAELRTSPILHDIALLKIKNYGHSPAVDVRVSLPPDLVRAGGAHLRGLAELLVDRYKKPIGLLAPGAVLFNTYFVLDHEAGQEGANKLPLPDDLTVEISYRSGTGRGAKLYHDVFRLSMREVQGGSIASPGDNTRDGLRIARALEAIARTSGGTD